MVTVLKSTGRELSTRVPPCRGEREAARRGTARLVRVLPEHAVGPVLRGAQGAEPSAQHHRGRGDPRGRRRGRAALPGNLRGWLHVLRQGRSAGTTRNNCGVDATAPHRVGRGGHRRYAGAALRVRTAGAARPNEGPREAPAASSSTSTATWSATRDVAYTTPFAINPGALTCGADRVDSDRRLQDAVPLQSGCCAK